MRGVATGAWRDRGVRIGLFCLVVLSCAWFGSWQYNANNATRLFAAISIVEQGDATIDEFAELTIDEARFGAHVYSDKAPGMTLLTVPIVAAVDAVTGETATDMEKSHYNYWLDRFLKLRLRFAATLIAGVLTALATCIVYAIGRDVTGDPAAGLFGALGFALGTTIWGWSLTIFGHAPVAALYLIAVWAIRRGTTGGARTGCAVLAGGSLGLAVLIEQQALIAGAVIAGWALWRLRAAPDRPRLVAAAVLAGAALLIPLLAYNLFAFGTAFRLGYQGVQGFAGMREGLFGLTFPRPAALWGITFGFRRGIVWVAPILLLPPWGLWRLWRAGERDLSVMAAAGATTVFLVNAAYVYWDGGASMGPRHAVPAIGLLALGLAPAWAAVRSGAARVAAGVLLALSMLINLAIAATDIATSEAYAFPLWQSAWRDHIRVGWLTNLPNDWFGWTPWAGMVPYVGVALPLIAWIVLSLPDAGRAGDATDSRRRAVPAPPG